MANKRKNTERTVVEVENFSVGFLRSVLGDKGRLATVNFTKKKDGSNRTLNGKTLVKSALVGGEAAYDASSRGQIRVADVNLYKDGKRYSGYRTVTAENVNWVTSGGKKYVKRTPTDPVLSFIQSITHDSRANTLRVILSGIIYLYFAVPRSVYLDLLNADDRAKFFRENIKDAYQYTRIG